MPKAKEVLYETGDLRSIAEAWHSECATLGLVEGPLYKITPDGMETYGRVGGCVTCNVWVAVDQKGNSRDVELNLGKEAA